MTSIIPDNPESLLTRSRTAEALTAAGFPVKATTLATKATRGGGPPYRKFGLRVLYRWGDAYAWAEGRLTAVRSSTSEQDVVAEAMPQAADREAVSRLTDKNSVSVQ
jgi:hypothetical protein